MKRSEDVASRESLMEQVSQVGVVEAATLQALQREIASIKDEWTRVYSDYQSGGWLTLSLLSETSLPTDTTIKDCAPVETTLLAKLPKTRAFLKGLGLNYMWARLARMEPNGFLWEHRDYQELETARRLRLHIPIVTNPSATLVIEGNSIHLAEGYIWKLNPVHRHGAANFGYESRIHILLDCYADKALDRMVGAEMLDERWVKYLPPIPDEVLARAMEISQALTRLGYMTSAEHLLLKMFHSYSLKAGATYDLLLRLYDTVGNEQRRQYWLDNKVKFLSMKNDKSLHAR